MDIQSNYDNVRNMVKNGQYRYSIVSENVYKLHSVVSNNNKYVTSIA